MLSVLQNSLINRKPVEMIYVANDHTFSQRRVTLFEVKGDQVRGFCHLRRSVRTFKIDQILSVYPLEVLKKASI